MTIVVFSELFPSARIEQFLDAELRGISSATGRDVLVFSVKARKLFRIASAAEYELVSPGWRLPNLGFFRLFVSLTRLAIKGRSLRSWYRLLTAFSATVVCWLKYSKIFGLGRVHLHAHWLTIPSTAALMLSEGLGCKFSITCHRYDIYDADFLNYKLEKAKFVRCISEHGKRALVEKIVCQRLASKVVVQNMGVEFPQECSQFDISSERVVLVCPARFHPVKGHEDLLNAVNILARRSIFGFKIIFVGSGPTKQRMLKLVSDYGIGALVEFRGTIHHSELLAWYKRGCVSHVVLPSKSIGVEHEGIPVSLMECMAYGVVPIATDSGGTGELVDNDVGWLVPSNTYLGLAEAIEAAVIDRSTYRKKSQKSRERVRDRFDAVGVGIEICRMIEAAD